MTVDGVDNTVKRRIALYAAAVAAVGSLAYAGWFRRTGADADTLLTCAQFELEVGLLSSAQAKARQVLVGDPANLHALLVDAHCRTRSGDHDGARSSYGLALASGNPDVNVAAEIRVQLALDSLRRGKVSDARDQLDGIGGLTNSESCVKTYYVKGVVLEECGDREGAIRAFERALAETCESQFDLVAGSACRLAALGQPQRAIAGLESQVSHLTERISLARAHYELAKLKFDCALADSAREHLRQLRNLPRAQLSGSLAVDAEYWKTKIGRGDVPAELGNLVSSSRSERDVK